MANSRARGYPVAAGVDTAVASDAGASKCARCSGPILDGELFAHQDGEWWHLRCWQILATAQATATSRELTRRASALIDQTWQRIVRSRRVISPAPPPLVCKICHTAIASVAELEVAAVGVVHARCRDVPRSAAS
jgi:hypothetical protein